MRSTGLGYRGVGHRFGGRKSGSLKMGFRRKRDKGQHIDDKKGQGPDLKGACMCALGWDVA